jgi:hypothetical protein
VILSCLGNHVTFTTQLVGTRDLQPGSFRFLVCSTPVFEETWKLGFTSRMRINFNIDMIVTEDIHSDLKLGRKLPHIMVENGSLCGGFTSCRGSLVFGSFKR